MHDELLPIVELHIDEDTELPLPERMRAGARPLSAVARSLLTDVDDVDAVRERITALEGYSVTAVQKIGDAMSVVRFRPPEGAEEGDALLAMLRHINGSDAARRRRKPFVRTDRMVACPRFMGGRLPGAPDPANPPPEALQLGGDGPGKGVTVAVLDTVPMHHPDLATQVTLVSHADAARHSRGSTMARGHCLLVAGMILRFAPAAQIKLIGVLGDDGTGSDSGVADALDRLADDDVQLVNLSLCAPDEKLPAIECHLQRLHACGIGIVAAAGNAHRGRYAKTQAMLPAAMPNVVGVASVLGDGDDLRLAGWTQRGPWVRCVARGAHRYGPFITGSNSYPGGVRREYQGWCYMDGTSFAAPAVAGIAAAYLSEQRGMTGAQALADVLAAGSDPKLGSNMKQARLVDAEPLWPSQDPGLLAAS